MSPQPCTFNLWILKRDVKTLYDSEYTQPPSPHIAMTINNNDQECLALQQPVVCQCPCP